MVSSNIFDTTMAPPLNDNRANMQLVRPNTALARGLLNVEKLHVLDEELLDVVTKLTPEKLAGLLAVLSKHDHFDLLGLPLEIRYMIYEHVLRVESGRVTSGHGEKKRKQRLDTNLLQVSKAIYLEAYHTFKSINECVLRLPRGRPTYSPLFDTSVTQFNRLELHIPTDLWVILPTGQRYSQKRPFSKL